MSLARRSSVLVALAAVLVACGGATDAPTVDDDGLAASPSPLEEEATEAPGATPTPADPEPTATPTATPTDEVTDEPSPAATGTAVPAAPACTLADDDAGIELFAPTDGATVPATFTIEGCGNTFEANWIWELTFADGTVGGGGFGTMTCGTGCVGSFEEEVTVVGSGPATLTVFEEDARDGGRANAVAVELVVAP